MKKMSYPSLLCINKQVLEEVGRSTPSEIVLAIATLVQAAHEDWDDYLTQLRAPRGTPAALNPAEFESSLLLASQYLIDIKLRNSK